MFVEDENDSYRVATEGAGIRDDNRTATGTIKSYRKTPYNSRYASKATMDDDGSQVGGGGAPASVVYADMASAPADEHRLLLHDLFARLVTDPQMGLSIPQVRKIDGSCLNFFKINNFYILYLQARANLELYGPNEIVSALDVPAWVQI